MMIAELFSVCEQFQLPKVSSTPLCLLEHYDLLLHKKREPKTRRMVGITRVNYDRCNRRASCLPLRLPLSPSVKLS